MAIKILWIDDEIDLLKPHQLFLEKKGYTTTMINNATDNWVWFEPELKMVLRIVFIVVIVFVNALELL